MPSPHAPIDRYLRDVSSLRRRMGTMTLAEFASAFEVVRPRPGQSAATGIRPHLALVTTVTEE